MILGKSGLGAFGRVISGFHNESAYTIAGKTIVIIYLNYLTSLSKVQYKQKDDEDTG